MDFDSLVSDPVTTEFNSETKSKPTVVNYDQGETNLPSFDDLQDDSERYGTSGQQLKAGLEGAAQGLIGPLAPLAETKLGIATEEDIRGRAEANPITHTLGEAAGLIAPALLTGGASTVARFTQAGALHAVESGLAKAGLVASDTLASKIGVTAAKLAIDNMLISGSDEISKAILNDPDQTAQTAITTIGLSGLIGGAIGGAAGGLAHTAPKAWKSLKASKLGQELENFKSRVVHHAEGVDLTNAVSSELENSYKAVKNPIDLGLDTGGSELLHEDAPKVQATLKKAYDKFEPHIEALGKKFFKNDELDPIKVDSFINNADKKSSSGAKLAIKNFLKRKEEYVNTVKNELDTIGIEPSFQDHSHNTLSSLIEQPTLGAKMADHMINLGLKEGGPTAAAGYVGSKISHFLNLPPEIGALIGTQALGPFFRRTLPTLTRSILDKVTNAEGFKAAADYISQVSKGAELLSKSSKGVFESSSSTLASLYPTKEELQKLDDQLKGLQTNMDPLMKHNDALNHYMPAHTQALIQSIGASAGAINDQRPDKGRKSPLDNIPVVSEQQKSQHMNMLRIAQQPLVLMDKIKSGTITAQDIKLIQNIYPALYRSMTQHLFNAMTDHISKGGTVPYKTRIGLSMFMAQPLDSTMLPSSIQAAQPQAQQPLPQSQGSPKGTPSAPSLQKLGQQYQTPGQAREMRSQRSK